MALHPFKKGQSGNPTKKRNAKGQYLKGYGNPTWKTRYLTRPNCVICGRPARRHHKESDGSVKSWRSKCGRCLKHTLKKYKYRASKKTYCEACGFIALHICQLDVDHTDGNRNNNSPENLRTLCANCHRLKGIEAGEHLNQDAYRTVEKLYIEREVNAI